MVDEPADEKWARRLERERRARRQAEQVAEQGMRELWLANQNLEERVRERTQALDRSLAALGRASRARQTLLADLSHELATPLHAITGNLELFDASRLPEGEQDRIAQARISAGHLDARLQALMAVAKVEAADAVVPIESRDPSEYLDELVARWQRPAARRGLLLVAELDSPADLVAAEWQRLAVAVDAILDACVQYATSGPVHVTVRAGGQALDVCVEDCGPPLPASAAGDDSPTSLTWAMAGRRGIGLALAQGIADESAMQLRVSSSTLGGVRAVLTLPIPGPENRQVPGT